MVGDTHTNDLHDVRQWVELQPHWRWLELDAGRHAWGHPQINYGMQEAVGDYLVFQDDDDVFAPDALINIRRATKHLDPPRPLIFKFKIGRAGGLVLPQGQEIAESRIGGHCLVVPNVKEKLGAWTDRYAGDWDFIESTLQLWMPLGPIFRPEVITFAR